MVVLYPRPFENNKRHVCQRGSKCIRKRLVETNLEQPNVSLPQVFVIDEPDAVHESGKVDEADLNVGPTLLVDCYRMGDGRRAGEIAMVRENVP